jgi:hypothetical protein
MTFFYKKVVIKIPTSPVLSGIYKQKVREKQNEMQNFPVKINKWPILLSAKKHIKADHFLRKKHF